MSKINVCNPSIQEISEQQLTAVHGGSPAGIAAWIMRGIGAGRLAFPPAALTPTMVDAVIKGAIPFTKLPLDDLSIDSSVTLPPF